MLLVVSALGEVLYKGTTSVHVDCCHDKATETLYGRGMNVERLKDCACVFFVRQEMVEGQAWVIDRTG